MSDNIHTCWTIYQHIKELYSNLDDGSHDPSLEKMIDIYMTILLFSLSNEDYYISESEIDFINYILDSDYDEESIETILYNDELDHDKFLENTSIINTIADSYSEEVALKVIDGIEAISLQLLAIDEEVDENEINKLTYIISEMKKSVSKPSSNLSSISNLIETSKPPADELSLTNLLNELESLIGLQSVKTEVENLCNLVRVRKLRIESGLATPPLSLHLVFTGNPGTGKTTIARLLAKIFKSIELISIGHLVEVDRSALVAGYVGQTALKTKEIINKSIGGILFIDEAYTLLKRNSESDYGQEAIDTLLKEMEDHRDELIVIVAGYTNEMNKFIQSNPGLESRFNKFIHFPDYTSNEMYEILYNLAEKSGYKLDNDAQKTALSLINSIYENKNNDNFGNGRLIRNIFEKVIQSHSNRIINITNPTLEDLKTIISDDILSITS